MYTLQMKRLFLSSGKWSNVGFLDFFKGKKKKILSFFFPPKMLWGELTSKI